MYEPAEEERGLLQCAPEISIQNLTFTYPNATTPALRNLSCHIAPGAVVGIVGGTGSGKSTLLKLLLRLYDPPANTVYMNDKEIHTISFSSLRQSIGYVPQDSFLFSRTIGENIAYSGDWPRTRIEAAARLAAVHEAIDEKPYGFAAVLGEKGKRLSGGQQQRVALPGHW